MTPVKEAAFAQIELLKKVVDFKMKFYPRTWEEYQEATPGTLRLVPPEYRLDALAENYANMRDMLYGNIPSFEIVTKVIQNLEREINSIRK